jgi:hypothetical protein
MAIIYNRFIYENGQDAAVITAIEAALAAAGWAETTSDGETLYKTALPDSNGAYGYVNLKADDGNSKIGVAVGADLGTDELGFSTMNGVQVGKRSTPGPASGSWTCVVMAFERWFIAFGLGDPEDAGSGAHESDGFLLGGGLYQPLFNLEGNHPLMAIGSQLYNSATNYGGKLFAGATTGPITATLMNTWISANLHGHQNYTNYAAAAPLRTSAQPTGTPVMPAILCRASSSYGQFGVLYDCYTLWEQSGVTVGQGAELGFTFNGYYYIAPGAEYTWQNDGFWLENYGGPLFFRFKQVV